ncbi:MAG: RnfABCDGE type electron transport complex subunit B [Firmicutes bacterium]|nr:RnfABCDGE type electron transport complex subunit B [Bacillota bacterium]
MHILIAVAALGATGLVLGLLLAGASKYLEVEQDERIPIIIDLLPGANCGACGYAGCAAFAQALAEGKAPVNGCPVGGAKTSEKLAKVLGVKSDSGSEKVAVVLCRGVDGAAKKKFVYEGIESCEIAHNLSGGDKVCNFGCLGFGDCFNVCRFDAIKIENGVAVIDPEKCTACGLCINACPKGIIRFKPKDKIYSVRCLSQEKGAQMKNICSAGCIACRLCEKACEFDAIKVVDNIAVIDYSKCTDCGKCFEVCPKKIIYKETAFKKMVAK